jgi:hypothetical protein
MQENRTLEALTTALENRFSIDDYLELRERFLEGNQ